MLRLIEADRLVRLPDAISFDQSAAMVLQGMTAPFALKDAAAAHKALEARATSGSTILTI